MRWPKEKRKYQRVTVDEERLDDLNGDDLRFLRKWWDNQFAESDARVRAMTDVQLPARKHCDQQFFAKELGIAMNTFARMERGELPISIPMARLIILTVATNNERQEIMEGGMTLDWEPYPREEIEALVRQHRG